MSFSWHSCLPLTTDDVWSRCRQICVFGHVPRDLNPEPQPCFSFRLRPHWPPVLQPGAASSSCVTEESASSGKSVITGLSYRICHEVYTVLHSNMQVVTYIKFCCWRVPEGSSDLAFCLKVNCFPNRFFFSFPFLKTPSSTVAVSIRCVFWLSQYIPHP